MFGLVGQFWGFELGLNALTQQTPTVPKELLDMKRDRNSLGVVEMEDKQVTLWEQTCPLLDGFVQIIKMPHDSVGEHNAKADIALVLTTGVYLVQLKTHESQSALHFKKECKVLVKGKWVVIPNPPVFWCDKLPTRLQLIELLCNSGFTSLRYQQVKAFYNEKLTKLKGKEVILKVLQKNLGSFAEDLVTLGYITQNKEGKWIIV